MSEKKKETKKETKKESKQAKEERKKDSDALTKKYFKWSANDEGKKGVNTHLQSQQSHMRRQRLARMNKLSPDVIRQLRNDVRKEVLGDGVANSIDYMRRNMSAVMFRAIFKEWLAKRVSRAFFIWKYSKLCINCLRRERLLVQAKIEINDVADKHKRATIIRVARRYLLRASVEGAFKRWKEDSKDDAERNQRKRRALKWFTHRKSMLAIEAWKELVAKKERVRQLLLRITRRHRNQSLALALQPWVNQVKKAQELEDQVRNNYFQPVKYFKFSNIFSSLSILFFRHVYKL